MYLDFLYDVEKLELNLSFSHTNCIKKNHVPHWNCVLKCWFFFRACFTSERNELIIWMFVISNLIKLFLINHRICSFLEFLDFFPYLFEFFETKIRQKFYPKKNQGHSDLCFNVWCFSQKLQLVSANFMFWHVSKNYVYSFSIWRWILEMMPFG